MCNVLRKNSNCSACPLNVCMGCILSICEYINTISGQILNTGPLSMTHTTRFPTSVSLLTLNGVVSGQKDSCSEEQHRFICFPSMGWFILSVMMRAPLQPQVHLGEDLVAICRFCYRKEWVETWDICKLSWVFGLLFHMFFLFQFFWKVMITLLCSQL